MATINVGSLYSQLQLDIARFRSAARTAERLIDHLRDSLSALTKQSQKALGQVIAPTITPGKLPFFQPAAPTPTITPPMVPTVVPQVVPTITAFGQMQAAGARMWGGLTSGITNFNASMGRLESSLVNFRTMFLAFAGFRFLSNAIGDIAAFDQKMAELRSVVAENAGFSEQAFAQLRQRALELGATTIFGPSDAAAAMTELSRAGFGANEVMSMITPTLQMAAIEHMGLTDASLIVSKALKNFDLPATDATRVTDVLAKVSATAATSVRGLGSAVGYVGPQMASIGGTIEETAAAMGTLSNRGIDNSRMGTVLRAVLNSLSKITPQARAALADMGLTIADVDPQTVGLTQAMANLAAKQMDLGHATRIFSREGATGALILSQNTVEMQKYYAAALAAEGTTNRMALTATNNLRDAMTQLGNVVQVAWIQLGDTGLTGSLRSMVDALTNAFRAMTGFLNPLTAGAPAAYELAAALKALMAGLTALVGLRLGGALGAFVIAHPIITGIAAVGAGLVGLYTLMTSESTRMEALQGNVNKLLTDMGRASTESSSIHIQNLRNQAAETIKLMETEIARLKNMGDTVTFMQQLAGLGTKAGAAVTTVGGWLDTFDQKLGEMGIAAAKGLNALLGDPAQHFRSTNTVLGQTVDAANTAASAFASLGAAEALSARQAQIAAMEANVATLKANAAALPIGQLPLGATSPYQDIFRQAAERYKVDIALLQAMARRESNFDAAAQSRAGAGGVMQLMPGTAKDLGVENVFDPQQNIMGGAKYMAQMLARYGGNVQEALAAYNAGMGRVTPGMGIPNIKETQDYVAKVLEFQKQYAAGAKAKPGGMGDIYDPAGAKEELATWREQIQARLAGQMALNRLGEDEMALTVERVRQQSLLTGDVVGLAEAEGAAQALRVANKEREIALAQQLYGEMLASGKVIDASDKARLEGELAELSIKRGQVLYEGQLVALTTQRAIEQARNVQETQRLTTSLQLATTAMQGSLSVLQAQGQTATTLLEQHNALVNRNLDLRGATDDEQRLVQYQQALVLAQQRYATEQQIYDLRLLMTQADIASIQAQQQLSWLSQQEQIRLTNELLQKQYQLDALRAAPPIQQQTLQPFTDQQRAMAAFPAQMAQSLTQGVQTLFTAFSEGGAKIGQTIQGMGKTILDTALKPLMTQITNAIQQLISGLGNIGPWAGAAIGVAMMAIGSLFNQQEARVTALGDDVKGNIESVERTRGLIAGESTVAVQALSENLGMAMRPSVEVLLRIEALVRMAIGGGAGVPLPANANSLYSGELIGSVRLG